MCICECPGPAAPPCAFSLQGSLCPRLRASLSCGFNQSATANRCRRRPLPATQEYTDHVHVVKVLAWLAIFAEGPLASHCRGHTPALLPEVLAKLEQWGHQEQDALDEGWRKFQLAFAYPLCMITDAALDFCEKAAPASGNEPPGSSRQAESRGGAGSGRQRQLDTVAAAEHAVMLALRTVLREPSGPVPAATPSDGRDTLTFAALYPLQHAQPSTLPVGWHLRCITTVIRLMRAPLQRRASCRRQQCGCLEGRQICTPGCLSSPTAATTTRCQTWQAPLCSAGSCCGQLTAQQLALRQGPLPVPEPMPRHVAAAILAELQPLCVVAAKLPLLALAGAMPLAYAFQEVFLELLALASYGLRCIATSVGSEPGDGSDTSR